jgi:hypothetical protein
LNPSLHLSASSGTCRATLTTLTWRRRCWTLSRTSHHIAVTTCACCNSMTSQCALMHAHNSRRCMAEMKDDGYWGEWERGGWKRKKPKRGKVWLVWDQERGEENAGGGGSGD